MKIAYFGIPTNYGAHLSGTEFSPNAFRKTRIIEELSYKFSVRDIGDVSVPNFLPRHHYSPIVNYPSPRIIWENINNFMTTHSLDEEFLLIVGGDCSIIVGTVSYLCEKYQESFHLLVLDAHLDNFQPSYNVKVGAATMGLWLLTNESMFWKNPSHLSLGQISVMGCHNLSVLPVSQEGFEITKLSEIRKYGIKQIVQNYFMSIPKDAKVFIHFDVDVLMEQDMPAAFFPEKEGLSLYECKYLLQELISDHRVIGIELAEFSPLKDSKGKESKKLKDMLVTALTCRVTS